MKNMKHASIVKYEKYEICMSYHSRAMRICEMCIQVYVTHACHDICIFPDCGCNRDTLLLCVTVKYMCDVTVRKPCQTARAVGVLSDIYHM
jgi:hypothetical protein